MRMSAHVQLFICHHDCVTPRTRWTIVRSGGLPLENRNKYKQLRPQLVGIALEPTSPVLAMKIAFNRSLRSVSFTHRRRVHTGAAAPSKAPSLAVNPPEIFDPSNGEQDVEDSNFCGALGAYELIIAALAVLCGQ